MTSTLTNADQILQSIDEHSDWTHYLILADAYADEGRWQEEEATRWIERKRKRPQLSNYNNSFSPRWYWWTDEDLRQNRDSWLPRTIWKVQFDMQEKRKDDCYGTELFSESIRILIQAYVQVRYEKEITSPNTESNRTVA